MKTKLVLIFLVIIGLACLASISWSGNYNAPKTYSAPVAPKVHSAPPVVHSAPSAVHSNQPYHHQGTNGHNGKTNVEPGNGTHHYGHYGHDKFFWKHHRHVAGLYGSRFFLEHRTQYDVWYSYEGVPVMFHPSEVCFQDLNTGEIFCVPVETVQSIAREDADYPSYDQPVPPDGWVPPPWKDPFSDHTHPPAGDH